MSTSSYVSRGFRPVDHEVETSHCASCPKLCRHTCPVGEAERRETVTPWGLMSAMYLEARGHPALEGSDGELVYHCAACRACQHACKFGNDVPGAVHGKRRDVFARGDGPERARKVVERFRQHGGNLYRVDLVQRLRALLPGERLGTGFPDVLLVDSTTLACYPEVVRDIADLLAALELNEIGFLVHHDLGSCGLPLYDAGDLEGLAAHGRKLRDAVGRRQRLLLTSPGDVHLLRDVYPRLGIEWDCEVVPLLDAIVPFQDIVPSPSTPGPATVFHHPCNLARPLRRVKEPLALVRKATGLRPREPLRTGEETFCCGGGGGLPLVLPGVADDVTRLCLERLSPREDEVLVTACSACRRRLEKVSGRPVVDLFSLLANAMKEPRGP